MRSLDTRSSRSISFEERLTFSEISEARLSVIMEAAGLRDPRYRVRRARAPKLGSKSGIGAMNFGFDYIELIYTVCC
jgi:hypothetical protein